MAVCKVDDSGVVKPLVVVGVVVALLAVPVATAGRRSTRQASIQTLDAGVLVQLNAIRSSHRLVPLKLNATLSMAAGRHSAEMVADGYFAHNSQNGSPFWKRLTRYAAAAPHGWSVGENLLWSSPEVDASAALRMWMASPEHRRNILDPTWREIGIAAVHAASAPGTYGGQPVTVITTDFGVRR
jgi:uncharacterized protein YkwD